MKMTTVSVFFVALALAIVAAPSMAPTPAHAGSAQQVKEESKEAYEAVNAYTFEKKKDAVDWFKNRQAALEMKIDKLKTKANKASGKTKEKWNDIIAVLEKQKNAAAKKAKELSNSSKDAWGHTKDGVISAYQKLEQAFDDAVKSF